MSLTFDRRNCLIAHDLLLYRFAPRLLLLADNVFEDVVHLLECSAFRLGNE